MRTLAIWTLAWICVFPVAAAVSVFGTGSHGRVTITEEVMINPSTALIANALTQQVRLRVRNAAIFNVGDEVMIHTIEDPDGRAGAFEFHTVETVILPDVIIIDTPIVIDRPVDFGGNHQVVLVPNYDALTVASGGRIRAADYAPPLRSTGGVIAFRVRSDLIVEEGGGIDATACGNPGDLAGGAPSGQTGRQGRSGLGLGTHSTDPNSGGGGGGSSAGGIGAGGGGAGYGWAGSLGSPYGDGGLGGEITLRSELLKLPLGSAGGSGGGGTNDASGIGGDGGGVIYLTAGNAVVSGEVVAAGSNGSPAPEGTQAGGGGGGSGGAILIMARNFHVNPTGEITTYQGLGGEGDTPGGNGGNGSHGRVRIARLGRLTDEGTVMPGAVIRRPYPNDLRFQSD